MRARLISLPVAFAALFFALLVTPAAQAQRDIDIERFRPALDSNGFLGLQGTQTPGHGRFGVSLFANWSTDSLVLSPPETEVIDNRLQMHAMVQVGLGERWAAALSVPFVVYQQTDDALLYDGVGGMPSAGTGDPRFVVRYRFLGDGTKYPLEGTLQFRDVSVDPTTASVILRAVFPNPKGVLLPNMFVRAVVKEGVSGQAIVVPQQTVTRNPRGEAVALVVDGENKVQQRTLTLDRSLGDQWLVAAGLQAGDRVIAEGIQKVKPGIAVKVVPFEPEPKQTANSEEAARPAAGAN